MTASGQPEARHSAGESDDAAAERGTETYSRQFAADSQSLSKEELATLRQLKARDREVRQHEAAHQAVGGQYAGAVSYSFRRGPDGIAYAVGGEVPIDVTPVVNDPQATIEKMRTVRAAALAPAQPSAQDRQVAAAAAQAQLQAQAELAVEQSASGENAPDPTAEAGPDEAEEADDGSRRSFRETAVTAYRAVSAFQDSARKPETEPTDQFA